jgi:hypothetical protein
MDLQIDGLTVRPENKLAGKVDESPSAGRITRGMGLLLWP